MFDVKYFVYLRNLEKLNVMESVEFVLYILIGVILIIRPFIGRKKRGLQLEGESMHEQEPTITNQKSWDELMMELKKATEEGGQQTEQQKVEPEQCDARQSAPEHIEAQPLKNSTLENKNKEVVGNINHEEQLPCDFDNVEELRKAVIYTEVLNRKDF